MGAAFRAVAIDYDGTLTEGARPSEEVLEAIDRIRRGGVRLVLVTGRILAELRSVFPDYADHFDAVVAENGAVLETDGVVRSLTAPVPVELDAALIERGVPFRRGQVLLACEGDHDVVLLEELRRLGLDCQLVRNRGELMVLPSGVSKGSGSVEALALLGISRHSALAIGDAENDLSLLDVCEIGVAVANAVPWLQEHADVVLSQCNGAGVAALLDGPLLRDELRVEPRRWQVELGLDREGDVVRLPASRINLLVTGGSGSGKSFAAGFLAERLVALGYCVCVFDPEGDHAQLGRLRGVVVVGGREGLPAPAQLARMVQRGFDSVVVDLSFAGPAREPYVRDALLALEKARGETGLPHWIFVDEAHVPFGAEGLARDSFDPSGKGFCLVTWRPMDLCERARSGLDFLLALPGEQGIDPDVREEIAGVAGFPAERLAPQLTGVGLGQAVLLRLGPPAEVQVLSLAPRWVEHVRHWHKYAGVRLPPAKRFVFRTRHGPHGAVAANLEEFHHEVRRCDPGVLRHHAGCGDFSRWLEDVIQDSVLAATVRSIEEALREGEAPWQTLQDALTSAIESRYLS